VHGNVITALSAACPSQSGQQLEPICWPHLFIFSLDCERLLVGNNRPVDVAFHQWKFKARTNRIDASLLRHQFNFPDVL